MAYQQQLKRLRQGVKDWNVWREQHPDILPDFSNADLSNADLSGADLNEADLYAANLSGADLSGAIVGQTIFGKVDLRTVKGLETVFHWSPSTIGTDTLLRSEGDIPETFLRKAGLTDAFI